MRRILCKLLFVIAWMASITAYADATTQIGSGSVCPDAVVQVPLKVSGLDNVAAISLALNFDGEKVTYVGFEHLHESLNNNVVANAINGKLYFSWYSTTPRSFANDTLVMFKFEGLQGGNAALTWDVANCEYVTLSGNAIPSTYVNGNITVYALPAITQQPSNVSVTAGSNVTFRVSATGYSISYQWQVNTGNGVWSNLTNNATYSNVTSWQLNVNNVTQGMNGYRYRCVVSGGCANTASQSATLYVGAATIVTTAGTASSCPGTTFAIPITVTQCNNVGAISLALNYNADKMSFAGYQNLNASLQSLGSFQVNGSEGVAYFTWASSGNALSLGSDTLVELLFEGESGNYPFQWNASACEYTNLNGVAISTAFNNGSVNIYYAPYINTQPVDRNIFEGQSTTFSVSAGGQGISYTWQVNTDGGNNWVNCVNGTYYANVSSSTLTVRNVTIGMDGYRYRCVVCGTCDPCAYSRAARLNVDYIIHTSVTSTSACPDEAFTVDVNVTNFNNIGALSLALAFNPSVLEFVDVVDVNDALGSNLLSNAYDGKVYLSWYSVNGVSIGDGMLLRLRFTGVTGSSSLNWDASYGEYARPNGTPVTMTYSNGYANIYSRTTVTSQPVDRTVFAGQSTDFGVGVNGQGIGCRWQVKTGTGASWTDLDNGEHYSNVTGTTLYVNNTVTNMNGYRYRCKLTGTCGIAYSESARLTVDITQPLVKAEDVDQACTGTVSQDILVDYFNNVGSFSLVLDYDTNYLRYLGYEGLNNALQSNSFVLNQTMGRIYISYASGYPVNIGSGTLFRLNFDSSGGISTNSWQTSNCEVTDLNGTPFVATYSNGYIRVFQSCEFVDIDEDYWAYNEIMYLCGRGIVTGNNCRVNPDDNIKRAQLAKIAYLGLFNHDVTLVSDYFPSPFFDLQDRNTYYYRYAKALSYLEYGDGVSAFDRNKMNFNPSGTISRIYTIKALLEAYNIPPTEGGVVIFNDVPTTHPMYGYVNSAALLGIIDDTYDLFRPDDPCKRAEAFVWLEHILNNPYINIPSVHNTFDLSTTDFFIPGNYTPYNFSSILGNEVGNYQHTTKSCFDIPGRGGNLSFEYYYNSYLTELPHQICATNPLGYGWSHNYNSYIINTEEILDDYGNKVAKPCLVVFYPNGDLAVYDNDGNPNYPQPITKGVYSVLHKVSSNKYELTDKGQNVYTFEKVNTDAGMPYMLKSFSDRNGNTTSYNYELGVDGTPRLSSVRDASNRALSFEYKAGTDYILSVTDPLNRSVRFVVADDDLKKFYNAKGDSICYFYNGREYRYKHLLDSIVFPKGNSMTNAYEQRKLVSTQSNDGYPTTINHNASYSNNNVSYQSSVIEKIDEYTSVSSNYQFDKNGNVTRFTVEGVADFTKEYNNPNDPTLVTAMHDNLSNITTSYEYDERGNVLKTIIEGGSIKMETRNVFNETNDLTESMDANGNKSYYHYDEKGNLLRFVDALGNETTMTYDQYGQLESVTTPEGVVTTFDYDVYGNQTRTSYPAKNVVLQYEYDLAGRMTKKIDPEGNSTRFAYDVLDNLIMEIDDENHTIVFVYDENENMTEIINAQGDPTSFTYDFDNDLLLSQTFQNITKYYSYNNDGTLASYTDPNGNLFSYTYDNAGRMTSDGAVQFSYYSNGLMKTVTKDGKAITYTYDAVNRPVLVNYDGQTVEYVYDNNSNIVELKYPGNLSVLYTYDATNKLSTVRDWNGKVTHYFYNDDGQLLSVEYPNGMTTTYSYDEIGRMESSQTLRQNGSIVCGFSYTMDNLGNHLSESVTQPYSDFPIMDLPQTVYTYNNRNQLLSDGINDYEYDYNGNTLMKGNTAFTYNVKDKLTNYLGDDNFSFSYDALGNRRSINNNGTYRSYVLDLLHDANVLVEKANSEVENYYVYGLGLLSRIKPDGSTSYYVYDYRGSTIAMVDDTEDAVITHKYQYDDFGNILQMEEMDRNPFRFVGQHGVMYDQDDLYYMRARYYDPSSGRFLSEDPIWSTNLYLYADNNPVNKVDPEGKWGEGLLTLLSAFNPLANVGSEAVNLFDYVIEPIQNIEMGAQKLTTKLEMESGVTGIYGSTSRSTSSNSTVVSVRSTSSGSSSSSNSSSSDTGWKVKIGIYYHPPVRIVVDPVSPLGVEIKTLVSENYRYKLAYEKKKQYMHNKMKRYENIRETLIDRTGRRK